MLVKTRKKRAITLPEITLTPLIDTALVLLVIFIITAPVMNNSIVVELPKGQVKEAPTQSKEITISVDKNGSCFLNGTFVERSALIEQLEKTINGRSDLMVYVMCDKAASFGSFAKVVDEVKFLAGIDHVVLVTQQA